MGEGPTFSLREAMELGAPVGMRGLSDMAVEDLLQRLVEGGLVRVSHIDELVDEIDRWLDFRIDYSESDAPSVPALVN